MSSSPSDLTWTIQSMGIWRDSCGTETTCGLLWTKKLVHYHFLRDSSFIFYDSLVERLNISGILNEEFISSHHESFVRISGIKDTCILEYFPVTARWLHLLTLCQDIPLSRIWWLCKLSKVGDYQGNLLRGYFRIFTAENRNENEICMIKIL